MIFRPLLVAIGALAILAGCTDPGTGDLNRAQTGALTGAVAGAVLGRNVGGGDRTRNMLIGTGVGAIAGGLIGQNLDRQAAELRRDLGGNVGVVNTGDEIVVTMPQDILFAVDSASLRPDLRRDLQTVAQSLLSYPDTTIIVTGHTDNTGSAAYNQSLSERRAGAVTGELIANGVPSRRVIARGAGLTQPIASNATAQGRAQNRRVEIVIRPNR
jgi:outer membrane protein OmpA-like peptidoglycan-associated protein